MIDLDAIQSRLDSGVESLTDTFDLLREVERLRAETDTERAESLALAYREQQDENDALRVANTVLLAERDLYREAWTDALRDERAAVVAWLRRGDECCVANADRIENVEHRREGEE